MFHNPDKCKSQPRATRPLLAIISAMLLALLMGSSPVLADNLSDLRTSGAIGESVTGKVVARDASAQSAAKEINARRSAVYAEKAAAQGISVEQVGKVYATEIIKKLPAGSWIQNESGQWSQK